MYLKREVKFHNLAKIFFWNFKVSEAATQRCSYEKVLWKYATNLQENSKFAAYFQNTFH